MTRELMALTEWIFFPSFRVNQAVQVQLVLQVSQLSSSHNLRCLMRLSFFFLFFSSSYFFFFFLFFSYSHTHSHLGPPGPTGLPGFDGRVGLPGEPVSTLLLVPNRHKGLTPKTLWGNCLYSVIQQQLKCKLPSILSWAFVRKFLVIFMTWDYRVSSTHEFSFSTISSGYLYSSICSDSVALPIVFPPSFFLLFPCFIFFATSFRDHLVMSDLLVLLVQSGQWVRMVFLDQKATKETKVIEDSLRHSMVTLSQLDSLKDPQAHQGLQDHQVSQWIIWHIDHLVKEEITNNLVNYSFYRSSRKKSKYKEGK